VQNYFNHSINSVPKMRMRILMNVIIKLLYVLVNVVSFFVLNNSLDTTFLSYGVSWMSWMDPPQFHRPTRIRVT